LFCFEVSKIADLILVVCSFSSIKFHPFGRGKAWLQIERHAKGKISPFGRDDSFGGKMTAA
jgi:hypothetical protein